MSFKNGIIVIPARYESVRLNGKPLADIAGKTLIQRSYERSKLSGIESVVVTDHEDIKNNCDDNGIPVKIISEPCATGTDRVARYVEKYALNKDWIINLQGDEPFANPKDLILTAEMMQGNQDESFVINGMKKIFTEEKFFSESIPKVLTDSNGFLKYMSRAPVPYPFNNKPLDAWEQVCVYGFRPWHLKKFLKRNSKTYYENIEDIEILRFIETGIKVKMVEMEGSPLHVDTPSDLHEAIRLASEYDS